MKAAVLRGVKDIRTETVPNPLCAPHGIIRGRPKASDIAAVIELLKSGKANTRGIISPHFLLNQAAEAFRTQLQDPTAVKVMVQP
ncbi:MAG: hypothetical protein PHF23_05985 [Smithellaceae bacterium]|nr:hypothetical protein [Smithellaceae bacterium]